MKPRRRGLATAQCTVALNAAIAADTCVSVRRSVIRYSLIHPATNCDSARGEREQTRLQAPSRGWSCRGGAVPVHKLFQQPVWS